MIVIIIIIITRTIRAKGLQYLNLLTIVVFLNINTDTSQSVVFSARRTVDLGPVIHDTALTFDRMALNVGEAFHPEMARFVAPFTGRYFFAYTFRGQYGHLDLKLNARTIRPDVAEKSGRSKSAKNTLAIWLMEGDNVWFVLRVTGVYARLDCTLYTCQFSGYLLTKGEKRNY